MPESVYECHHFSADLFFAQNKKCRHKRNDAVFTSFSFSISPCKTLQFFVSATDKKSRIFLPIYNAVNGLSFATCTMARKNCLEGICEQKKSKTHQPMVITANYSRHFFLESTHRIPFLFFLLPLLFHIFIFIFIVLSPCDGVWWPIRTNDNKNKIVVVNWWSGRNGCISHV